VDAPLLAASLFRNWDLMLGIYLVIGACDLGFTLIEQNQ